MIILINFLICLLNYVLNIKIMLVNFTITLFVQLMNYAEVKLNIWDWLFHKYNMSTDINMILIK